MHPQMIEADLVQIKSFWPEMPANIDAAYEDPANDHVLLFRGKSSSESRKEQQQMAHSLYVMCCWSKGVTTAI